MKEAHQKLMRFKTIFTNFQIGEQFANKIKTLINQLA